MTNLDLKKFLTEAAKKLKGDWVVIGGTVLPLVNSEYRVTVDIDMIPLAADSNEVTLSLMELASSLGLPIEAINAAGLFFLKKIPNWRKRLTLHTESKSCRIYRPNLDLYIELKVKRLSESDFSDLVAYTAFHKKQDVEFDVEACKKVLKIQLKETQEEKMKARLVKLLELF